MDLAKRGVVGMPTAAAAVGQVLHVFMWDAPNVTGARHVSVNTATTPPTLTSYGSLPQSKYRCGTRPYPNAVKPHDGRWGPNVGQA
jgi:hypothetical protein